MFISTLKLENFRNYDFGTFEFHKGLNVLVGDNAQGKTNAAEAIFYLCTGYSPRATRDKQVIRYGEKQASACGTAVTRYGETGVEVRFSGSDKKTAYVNGVQVLRIGEILGNINSVFFNPGELKLIQESPQDRRRFLDISLSQMGKPYFYALQRYNKIIAQRNNLLKDESEEVVRDTLPVWDVQLARVAREIIYKRNEFLRVLAPFARDAHAFLTDGKEDLQVSADYKYDGTMEQIEQSLLTALREAIDKDLRLGYTTVGPHRDDMKIRINGEDVRVYGSQGQQRTAALSIKLAEVEIFRDTFGEYPVLILDDVMSELDRTRRKRLLSRVQGVQTLLTCTHVDEQIFGETPRREFLVEDGKVVSVTDKYL